jgi:hypothetical protein
VLIDAGSTKHPTTSVPEYKQNLTKSEIQNLKKTKQDQIISTIKALTDQNTTILCIISHGDEDH